jgi:hypothetical protein
MCSPADPLLSLYVILFYSFKYFLLNCTFVVKIAKYNIHTFAVSVMVDLQTNLQILFAGMTVFYIVAKFRIRNSYCSLLIAIKPKSSA